MFDVDYDLVYGSYDVMFFLFFFKQKTAYEMRISDWSSDVCSSDLPAGIDRIHGPWHRSRLPVAQLRGVPDTDRNRRGERCPRRTRFRTSARSECNGGSRDAADPRSTRLQPQQSDRKRVLDRGVRLVRRSEEHTYELPSLMRI